MENRFKIIFESELKKHNPKYSREYFIEKALSNEPSIRIFTESEARKLYKYIKGGIPELKAIRLEIQKGGQNGN